ncbi:hypothetical protein Acr_04g0000620 [Actinidia rufa]|uniref:Uncharacterized protein n=1 Tax=Actinidia rufa TaxID=165716 RepID=A0A7J0EFS1_9ERIC|nr:hypothetical protein Acr_04g0000620 [Actinidia rufa]
MQQAMAAIAHSCPGILPDLNPIYVNPFSGNQSPSLFPPISGTEKTLLAGRPMVAMGARMSMWHNSLKLLAFFCVDENLKLREFSKSITERTYTWYANLTPCRSVPGKTWCCGSSAYVVEEGSSREYNRREPLRRDQQNSRYCIYHRAIRHAMKDCWALRHLLSWKIAKGELEVPKKDQGVDKYPLLRHDKRKEQVMMLSCYEADEVSYFVQEPVVAEPEEDFPLDADRLATCNNPPSLGGSLTS